jgi:glycosyltransferase involved in cell wall biosynthesis
MTKISVIVPVYNVEKYLSKCLDTLVNQTLKDIEIIVVNDGSPDNSEKIVKDFMKKYKNISYYKKVNGGLSDARNYGLKKAHGEYIAFVDSDDYVSLDMYEKMYHKAKEGNFDMVVCDLNYVYEGSDKIMRAYSNIEKDTTDIKKTMLNIYPAAWNKIFKKELFASGIEFKKGVWFEDVEFIYRLLPDINSIGVIHEPFNQYLQRPNSITSSIDKRIYHYIDNWNGILDYYKEKKIYDKYYKELEYSYVRYLYATFIRQASKYDKKDYLEAVSKAITNVKNNFPNYRKNKYFYKNIKGLYLVIFNKSIAKIMYRIFHK